MIIVIVLCVDTIHQPYKVIIIPISLGGRQGLKNLGPTATDK